MNEAYYSFLPHLRLGLAGLLTNGDPLSGGSNIGERAKFNLNIPVQRTPKGGGSVPPENLSHEVLLKGPGDVVGINSKAIVKVSPADWVTNFESNYLPYIEFYDEDFPWRYTPAAANGTHKDSRLRPWVALVVLEESEFSTNKFNGILPSITLQAAASAVFPKAEQMWAWAHVHVNAELSNNNSVNAIGNAVGNLKILLANNPDKAISRVLCPRKLKPNTGYHAFLIPTFELGRRAGLGLGIDGAGVDALAPSWNSGTGAGTDYPVYHQWFFKTGAVGDFESLVGLLKPRAIGNDVGKRAVDLQLPGHPWLDLKTADPVIGLEGALTPPNQTSDSWPPSVPDVFTQKLKSLINLPADLKTQAAAALPAGTFIPGSADPVIAPPIYGRWHALQDSVTGNLGANWLESANLDPRYRIFAGAGAELVRTKQEEYMHIAWKQVGQVIKANLKIRRMQLAAQASEALHEKHLEPLGAEDLIGISNPVHTRVKIPGVTAYKAIKDSVVPNTMFSAAFRRMTRAQGPLMRSVNATATTSVAAVTYASMVQDVNTGAIQIAPLAGTPAGQVSLTALQNSSFSPAYINGLQGQSNFSILTPTLGGPPPFPVFGPNSFAGQQFVSAATLVANFLNTPTFSPSVNSSVLDTGGTATQIKIKTLPQSTVLELAKKQIILQTDSGTSAPITKLDIVLAAPKIDVPVYREMVEESTEWLMPNLNSIAPNSISLLKTNQNYIEAYMLGMNHEMARELLWRGYPTDQRGTCFSFFWGYQNSFTLSSALAPFVRLRPDFDAMRDIKPIHQWKTGNNLSLLGYNTGRPTGTKNLLVLTIRGELLRKYPGSIVYLQQAEWDVDSSGAISYSKARKVVTGTEVYPIFSASLEPDIYFLGFDKEVEEVRGGVESIPGADPGYFFVFQERAGEVRFGADEIVVGDDYSLKLITGTWSGLNWGHIQANVASEFIDTGGNITSSESSKFPSASIIDPSWGDNSADMAHILLQDSVKLYVHAKELIPA